MFISTVILDVDFELNPEFVNDIKQAEYAIHHSYRNTFVTVVQNLMRKLGILGWRGGGSIIVYFECKTEEELQKLHKSLLNGKTNAEVEKLFNLLLKSTKIIRVKQCTWNNEYYEKCLSYLQLQSGKYKIFMINIVWFLLKTKSNLTMLRSLTIYV